MPRGVRKTTTKPKKTITEPADVPTSEVPIVETEPTPIDEGTVEPVALADVSDRVPEPPKKKVKKIEKDESRAFPLSAVVLGDYLKVSPEDVVAGIVESTFVLEGNEEKEVKVSGMYVVLGFTYFITNKIVYTHTGKSWQVQYNNERWYIYQEPSVDTIKNNAVVK